jgi:predicted permease
MGRWIDDVRVALRGLARRPGLAGAVVLTLGLGIGATSAIYSVVDAVLLRPLPYAGSERLVAVGNTFPGREWEDQVAGLQHLAGVSVLNWQAYRARLTTLTDLEALESTNVLIPDRGDGPDLASAGYVSNGLFTTLGVSPVLGRMFLPEEHSYGAPAVMMLSHGGWLRRFGGDPSVVGRSPDGGAVVVGILPPGFEIPEAMLPGTPDFWMPLQPDSPRYESRGRRSLVLLARLASGATLEQARAEARAVAASVAEDYPDGNVYDNGDALGLGANSMKEATVGASRRVLLLFLSAAALLLLISALNAATLLLARTLERSRELSVRSALGAGRRSLVRLVLTEGLLLAVGGGVLGTALAFGGVQAVHQYGPASIPRMGEIALDGRALAAALVVTLAAGLLTGLLPALRHGRDTSAVSLHGGAGGAGSVSGTRMRNMLVAGQVAVAVVLLSGAGLLMSSFVRLRTVDPGFDAEGLLSLRMDTKRPGSGGGEPWQDWDAVLTHVGAVPGVVAVAGTSNPPFQDPFWAPWVRLPDEGPDVREPTAGYSVTPGYFGVVGTDILKGRDFGPADGPEGPYVAIVNETWAARRLGGADPIGVRVRFTDEDERWVTVVGVVEDVIQGRTQEGRLPAVYVPYTQVDWPFIQVVARLDVPASAAVPGIRQALARFSPSIPPRDVRAMQERIAGTRSDSRFQMLLIGSFAILALLLASAGLYGSLSHSVSRRSRELGIRVALGAAGRGIVTLVVGQGMRVAGAGLALGLVGALAVSRVLESLLYGITPRDPGTYVGVAAVLTFVAALASFVPARRATRVDPVEVLKTE